MCHCRSVVVGLLFVIDIVKLSLKILDQTSHGDDPIREFYSVKCEPCHNKRVTCAGCFSRDWQASKLSELNKLGKLSKLGKLGMLGFDKQMFIFISTSSCLL